MIIRPDRDRPRAGGGPSSERLCLYCGRARGSRRCPALEGPICARCCGEHRGVEIECPARCPHYQKHEAYQRERLGAEFRRAWLAHTERFYEEERFELLDFMVYLEVLIYQYYRERTAGRDEEILEALELVRRELSDLVMIVESATTPLGRHLLEGVEVYLEERELDRKAALEGVEATIDFLKRFSGDEGGRNPRRYLQGLMGHVAQDLKPPEPEEEEVEGEGEGIITPRIITPEEFRRELEQREWG